MAVDLAPAPSREISRTIQDGPPPTIDWVGLNIAHEISQPLAAIINYIRAGQRLLANGPAAEPDRVAAALEGAMIQALHAERIVTALRAVAARGEADKAMVSVATIVRSAIAVVLPEIERCGVQVSQSLDPLAQLVLADRVQIEQVIVNLMRNAMQAMQDSPRRELSIASRWRDGLVEVSVGDSGRGLADTMRGRLFEPFVTTRPDGTGLGLSICRAIIDAHGGSLSYHPGEHGGSVFRFTLTGVAEP